MKNFMSRLCQERRQAKKNRRSIKLKEETVQDLVLHQKLLNSALTGANMNLLASTQSTYIYIYTVDTCPFGLGRYYSAEGQAWRWKIPTNLQFIVSINMLEYMAAIIGEPWKDIFKELSCTVSMTGNTLAAGWLWKSNCQESEISKIKSSSRSCNKNY